MGLGVQHFHVGFPEATICVQRAIVRTYVYPDQDPDQDPVLATAADEGCPACSADNGTCQGEERCWKVGNPGFGYHGFDYIFMGYDFHLDDPALLVGNSCGHRKYELSDIVVNRMICEARTDGGNEGHQADVLLSRA